MIFTAAALRDFLEILPYYQRLSAAERRMLASIERPSQTVSSLMLGDTRRGLIIGGFLRPALANGRCPVAPSRHEFIHTVRRFRAHSLLPSPKPDEAALKRYLTAYFTTAEMEVLRTSELTFGDPAAALYRQISSPDWLNSFLNAEDESWEARFSRKTKPLLTPEILDDAQDIVRELLEENRRMPLFDLSEMALDPDLFSRALYAAMHYLMVFPSVDPDSMEVMLGLWPATISEAPVTGIPAPHAVKPGQIFEPLFLVEDMTALLVACASDPFPLRSTDDQLFSAKIRQLAAILRPLPKWIDEAFDMDSEVRVPTTVSYLHSFDLIDAQKHYESPKKLVVSERGYAWMKLGLGDRMRVLLDGMLDRHQKVPGFEKFGGARIGATTARFHVSTRVTSPPDIPNALLEVFRSLEGDDFYVIEQIVAFSQMSNPLLEIYRKDKNAYFSSENMYFRRTDAEGLKQAWAETIHHFVRTRLVPSGAVRVGMSKEGISIAITPAGRYLLNQTEEWKGAPASESQVIVQPNFEVTFLGESPTAEVEIGRFAERRKQSGTLFQITKKSIFAAAIAGINAELVFETLERVCSKEVPANVRREIQGWFAQCRRVNFEVVTLIRCPDPETAIKVMGLAKDLITPLTDTILEYRSLGNKQHAALVKKLKEIGVIVHEHKQPARF